MKLESDPKVVKRLAEEREDENWRFRSFLKGIDLKTEELDAMVHRLYEEAAGRIDCCACGNCCREVTPVLDDHDILRLATGLGMAKDHIIERFLVTDKHGDMIFRNTPCPMFSGNLCTVYDHRPEACRSFPHLHKEDIVFRLIGVVQNCSVCPIVFNVLERLKAELQHQGDDVREEDEIDEDWI
ncbi:MAG: YkgJ family cysteine cluster protein [Desulfatiglandaceae bacterium]